MGGNFWESSHCDEWLVDKVDLMRERQSDLAYLVGESDDRLPMRMDLAERASNEYQKIQIFFSNFIQVLGEQLKLRQQVIATATLYFKRFYSQNSLRSIDPLLLAPTTVFLASKVEEFGVISNTRLISTCSSVLKNKFSYAYPNQDFPYRSTHIVECEFYLLENLDCCLVVFQPYRPLIHFVQDILSTGLVSQAFTTNDMLPVAWRIVNDSLRTDVGLHFPPYQIALAAIHIASFVVTSSSTTDQLHHQNNMKTWFQELNVDLEAVKEISNMILNLYRLWKSFDPKKEMANLLSRMPKPVLSPPVNASS